MIIFESHSTSEDNEKKIASGWLDPPLSKQGIEQAKNLGTRYEKDSPSQIYVSDFCRCYQTAQIAFGHRSIPIIQDFRLREWNYGKYNGALAQDVEALKINHIQEAFPDGESLEQVFDRFISFKQEFLHSIIKDKILIIGHRAIYYALEFYFRKIPLNALLSMPWTWQPGWHYV